MMVRIRFYQELNFFLKKEQQQHGLEVESAPGQTVKDLIESFSVPHVEVDLVLVNGESVDFSYQLREGDSVAVYPVFESLDISTVNHLRPEPLREPRFIADVHLGTLARRLRTLGFYTEYQNHADDSYLAERSAREGLILLSRDRQLLMRRIVSRGVYIKNTKPNEQVRELAARLDLYEKIRPFKRCVVCNGLLRRLEIGSREWEERQHQIPPGVRKWCRSFRICDSCGKIFWRGSHLNRLQALLHQLEQDARRKAE
ncbi:MAG TPA: twitching motility protein PilT [Sediminispirochaeta sp.]|nr:twitching motility protein PilT [Sediminispirochaeta sp.]